MTNSPSAFPVNYAMMHNGETVWPEQGRTLRDYFAGQALAGMLSNGRDDATYGYTEIAVASYAYADKMMEARALESKE